MTLDSAASEHSRSTFSLNLSESRVSRSSGSVIITLRWLSRRSTGRTKWRLMISSGISEIADVSIGWRSRSLYSRSNWLASALATSSSETLPRATRASPSRIWLREAYSRAAVIAEGSTSPQSTIISPKRFFRLAIGAFCLPDSSGPQQVTLK